MRIIDGLEMSVVAIVRYPLRSAMLLLAVAIGVAAVLALTSLGEGARLYVTGQLGSLGSHLLVVSPGKSDTAGIGAVVGRIAEPARPLTLGDAVALRHRPHVAGFTPIQTGEISINHLGRERTIKLVGSNHSLQQRFDIELLAGRFLPAADIDSTAPVATIGATIARELFGSSSPLGQRVRLGDRGVRIIGVMRQSGQAGGFDVDETAFVPIGLAMQVFDLESIQRILIEVDEADHIEMVADDIRRTIKRRHLGKEDVTVIDQGAILDTFNAVFLALTRALAGIASISLVVAGTLIMNVMLVAVSQRTAEIGLLKAIGAKRRQIIGLFLAEAFMLSLLGAAVGVLVGQLAISLLGQIFPTIQFAAPLWAVIAAVLIAVGSGLLFGILPARRAADLDPVEALAGH